jgi:hypothetical protein
VQTTAATGGVSGYEMVSTEATLEPGNIHSVLAICPSGKKVLGGGWVVSGPANPLVVIRNSHPLNEAIWRATFKNEHTSAEATGKVWAICATAMF